MSGTRTVDHTDKKERFATLCTVKVGGTQREGTTGITNTSDTIK